MSESQITQMDADYFFLNRGLARITQISADFLCWGVWLSESRISADYAD